MPHRSELDPARFRVALPAVNPPGNHIKKQHLHAEIAQGAQNRYRTPFS